MGVEYMHYLIPEDNTYKPKPDDLRRLIDALLDRGFVPEAGMDAFKTMGYDDCNFYECADPIGCFAHVGDRSYRPFPCPCSEDDLLALGDRDYRLVWSVESSNESGLKYPLSPFPEWGDAYYELELHAAQEFVYHCSEQVDPFDTVDCACGRSLEYTDEFALKAIHPVYSGGRIYRLCPTCARPFRPQDRLARVRDGITRKTTARAGGATYLFAVVVDCGKGFARDGGPIRASDEFKETVTWALGQRFYEMGDYY